MKKIVLENRRFGIREVTKALNISYWSTQHIVVHVSGMKRVAARLVPKDLNFCKKNVDSWLNKNKSYCSATVFARFGFLWLFLFPKLKYPLWGMRHESIQAIKWNPLKELKAIPAEAYRKSMENWINHWHACIGSKGAYFANDNGDFY